METIPARLRTREIRCAHRENGGQPATIPRVRGSATHLVDILMRSSESAGGGVSETRLGLAQIRPDSSVIGAGEARQQTERSRR